MKSLARELFAYLFFKHSYQRGLGAVLNKRGLKIHEISAKTISKVLKIFVVVVFIFFQISSKMDIFFFWIQSSILYEFLKYRPSLIGESR